MPGPKMGPRPRDFNEELVRRSPTFRKWEGLLPGTKLRYACRDFVKGQGDDEERLMRRIMIARRNNVRDHKALKWARRMQSSVAVKDTETKVSSATNAQVSWQAQIDQKDRNKLNTIMDEQGSGKNNKYPIGRSRREAEAILSTKDQPLQGEEEPPSGRRTRRPTTLISDDAIKEEMDVSAVESTRSYKTWQSLPIGAEFLYNQKYIKGHEAHDWLLKKNIWRRMRYRRGNKKMMEEMLSREREQYASIPTQDQSKKRRHDATADVSPAMHSTGTVDVSNKRISSAAAVLAKTMDEADAPTMVVGTTVTTATSVLGMTSGINARNHGQDSAASTASEIVDHALLSTNTEGVAPIPPSLSEAIPAGDTIALPIGLSHHQQQFQDHSPPVQPLHHQHHMREHEHHDATESAAAFAASIALVGAGIGADGDLNSHHDAAVADSAAVEAAVAAALAATDAKSNAYHLHHAHHLTHSAVNDHAGLIGVDHVPHDGNDPMATSAVTDCRELQSVPQMAATSASPVSMGDKTTMTTAQGTTNHAGAEGVVAGLGLALDAAARLAAAAAATGTCASDEAVLAATKAVTTVTGNATADSAIGIDKASSHGSSNGTAE